MREKALFMNGNYESNLQGIANVHAVLPEQILFIQPHGPGRIADLRDNPPSVDDPVTMYISITTDLNQVHFTAEVVGWDDKEKLSSQKRDLIDKVIKTLQAPEPGVFDVGFNLIHVRRLVRVEAPFRVNKLIKVSDDEPLGDRATAGGWSYVHRLRDDAGDA